MEAPEQCQCRRYSVFIVNFERISHCSDVPIVVFEQLNTGWFGTKEKLQRHGLKEIRHPSIVTRNSTSPKVSVNENNI